MRAVFDGERSDAERNGEHLRRFRLTLGIGVRDAAVRCGVGAVEYGEWERGKRTFDFLAVSAQLADEPEEG